MAQAEKSSVEMEERIVVIVGKTGSGKSTIGNKITDNENFKVYSTLSSGTKSVDVTSAELTLNKKIYKIKVVDTVGLFDTDETISNDEIIADIKEQLSVHAKEGLNLIIFALRQGRFTKEEKDTFLHVKKEFGESIKSASALVITNCDSLGKQARIDLINQYKSSDETSEIAKIMTRGIFTVSFPNPKTLDDDEKELYERKAAKDQIKLQELVVESNELHMKKELNDERWWKNVKKKRKCIIL